MTKICGRHRAPHKFHKGTWSSHLIKKKVNVNLHKVTSSSESPSNVNPEICSFTPNEQFFVYTMARTSYIQWADLHFIINRRSQLDFYSASSLKQQYMDRHVAPLGNMTLIPSKPVFAFILKCCMLKLVRRQQISIHSLWFDPTGVQHHDLMH